MSFFKTAWRRYLAWLVLVTLFSFACVLLSRWQFERRTEVLKVINTIAANYDQKPQPLQSVLSDLNLPLSESKQWLPVSVSGHYLGAATTLVRNRSLGGYPGFEILVPFLTDQNTVVIVDRGWVPTGSRHDYPDSIPQVQNQRLSLIGRLLPTEAALNRTAPKGQIPSINLSELATMNSAQTYINAYLLLDRESIKLPQAKHLPRPQIGEGNHLSYAIQWIIFSLLAIGTLVWAVRKELQFYRASTDPTFILKPKRKTPTDVDADYEDSAAS